MSAALTRLSKRAGIDPFFLAFALAEYAAAERLDDAGLAIALGTTPEVLPHVRLCRAPRPDPDGFRADVTRIASRFGLDAVALAGVAKHGLVVAALRSEPAPTDAEIGTLLAARDRPVP